MHFPERRFFFALVFLLASACGDDSNTGSELTIPCTDDELYDQVSKTCVPRARESNSTDSPDMGGLEIDMNVDDDAGTDMPPANCDEDRDGALSEACGGNDCDDTTFTKSPFNQEFCDAIDNDCSGSVNDGIRCTFYAHSGQQLYEIDPFKLDLREVATELPYLQDIDTHPSGTLYGVTRDGMFRFDRDQNMWTPIGDFGRNGPSDPNGMAIDFDGTVFVTSEAEVFTVDIMDGYPSFLGDMDGEFYSSGDCVVNKYDTLYMTSKHDASQDHLIELDRATGKGTQVGPIGFSNVYGLTSAWGTLYGLTGNGELIRIDPDTGAGELVHQFQGISFFGAASSPGR